jgi:hypothetical protein
LMFESPSGSTHRLFKHPGGDVRIRTGALDKDKYPGVDIKGDGGMSVAPPSRTHKGVYKWLNKQKIAKAPARLLELVVKPARAPRKWRRGNTGSKWYIRILYTISTRCCCPVSARRSQPEAPPCGFRSSQTANSP